MYSSISSEPVRGTVRSIAFLLPTLPYSGSPNGFHIRFTQSDREQDRVADAQDPISHKHEHPASHDLDQDTLSEVWEQPGRDEGRIHGFVGYEDPTILEVGDEEPVSEEVPCQSEADDHQAAHSAPDGVHALLGFPFSFMAGIVPTVTSHLRLSLPG